MMRITKTEAMDYAASLPTRPHLNSDDYWFRGFAFVMTVVACCTVGTINIAFAIVCAIVFGVALVTSCKFIMSKCSIDHYVLLSDSFMFLSCSMNMLMITTYIIYIMNGNLAISFAITLSINIIDIFLMAIYGRTMIKKKLYKKEKRGSAIAVTLLGIGGAGLGWTLAKHSFVGAAGDQQLSILATVTLLSGLMCNFGLIGFMKYYCCTVITKLDHTK